MKAFWEPEVYIMGHLIWLYRVFWEIINSFVKDCKVLFEKVERIYKEKVKKIQGYLDFRAKYKEILAIESFWEMIESLLREFW